MKWPIQPFFDSPPLLTSVLYFALVFVFAINRSQILNILGKLLTPAIILILFLMIGTAVFSYDFAFGETNFPHPFSDALFEGYQTFDAIGAVVVGGVIIISINLRKEETTYEEKKGLIRRAGWWAGLGLFLIYGGLILTGALMQGEFNADIPRTALLNGISAKTLGGTAQLFLSILVGLACFTTAVGIVTGTADFVKYRFHDSRWAYLVTALLGCLLGIGIGQFDVASIIAVALPALMFIYPITIVLILLNAIPDKWASEKVFRVVVAITVIFSVPDFLGSIGYGEAKSYIQGFIPLSTYSLGWVLPAGMAFAIINIFDKEQA